MKAIPLGRYYLLDRIAFGGMAEIYRAKTFDEQGRVHMVAVKRILSHLGRDEEFIRMLVDEARIASLMQHENIAKTYEFCHAQGEYFIAMEYVDGKDGRTLLDRCRAQRRWIPPELCAFIMMNTLRALHCAHNQRDRDGRPLNLIHRDVSPSNVICSYSGEVKLCDFGIAKATLSRVQTRSGVIKGKVKYMSPEQAMGRKLDLRSDIFSAGSVLYEFLTKVPPFLAPNEMELLVLVRETRYQPVRERNPMVPPALEAIVDTAMSRTLEDRYQTAAEFADALEQYLRIHAPRITRSHLGQFVRHLFAEDIDRELRALEEYVVEDQGVEEVGVNLIAEDLPPGEALERLSATQASRQVPPREAGDMTPQDIERGEIEIEARRPPADDPGLGQSPTVILESSDLLAVGGQSPTVILESSDLHLVPGAGAAGSAPPQAEILWSREEPVTKAPAPELGAPRIGEPGDSDSPSNDYQYGAIDPHLAALVLAQEGLHDARTVILELEDESPDEPAAPPRTPPGPVVSPPGPPPSYSPSPPPGQAPPGYGPRVRTPRGFPSQPLGRYPGTVQGPRGGVPGPSPGVSGPHGPGPRAAGFRPARTLSGTGPGPLPPPGPLTPPGPPSAPGALPPRGRLLPPRPLTVPGLPAPPRQRQMEDLHDLPTGQIEPTGPARADGEPPAIGDPAGWGRPPGSVQPGSAPSGAAPARGDILSTLSAAPTGGTAELEVSDLIDVAAARRRAGATDRMELGPQGAPPVDLEGGTAETDLGAPGLPGDTPERGPLPPGVLIDGERPGAVATPEGSPTPLGDQSSSGSGVLPPSGDAEHGTDETELPEEPQAPVQRPPAGPSRVS